MTEVSVMVLPSRSDDPGAPATVYLLRHGSWHEVPSSASTLMRLDTQRAAVEQLLAGVMQRIAHNEPAGAGVVLKAKSREWWDSLVPDTIRRALTEACREAERTGTVPRLLVNAHPKLEWMPWELLHDGVDYLGLRFQIARLPIVANGGEPPAGSRLVTRAVNLLGTRVLTDAEQEAYQSWAGTFDPFQHLGVSGCRWPPDGLGAGWPTLDDLVAQKDADIIHITAHGGVDEYGRQYLALDLDDDLTSSIDDSIAAVLAFKNPGPLVFGNACGSLAAGQTTGPTVTRGLGVSFFDRGATAYIGSMAPLGTLTAIRFAACFYRFLLQDGLCVGEALRRAKLHQASSGLQDPSYLFYCLYGLPGTRFLPAGAIEVTEQPPSAVAEPARR